MILIILNNFFRLTWFRMDKTCQTEEQDHLNQNFNENTTISTLSDSEQSSVVKADNLPSEWIL